MADYKNKMHIKLDPYNQEPQHIGQAAGGRGTMGALNDGDSYRQPINYKGTMGPDRGVAPSTDARRLIAKSTGVQVNDGVNPPIYGRKGTY